MDRRRFLLISLAGALAAPVGAEGQQVKNVPRLGYLSSSSADREKSLLAAFQQGLQELGYSAGRNIVIELRIAEGRYERLPDLAAELVRLKVDVLVVADGPATHAAKKATGIIPIVMTSTADPVGIGVAASLAHPGGNVTGLSDFHAGVVTKRLELLRDLVPSASRVAVLSNPSNPTNPLQLKLIQAVAPALGVTLFSSEAKGPDDIDAAPRPARRSIRHSRRGKCTGLRFSQPLPWSRLQDRHRPTRTSVPSCSGWANWGGCTAET